jgi:hypothetical protein
MHFQRTARSILAVCLIPGDNATWYLQSHLEWDSL